MIKRYSPSTSFNCSTFCYSYTSTATLLHLFIPPTWKQKASPAGEDKVSAYLPTTTPWVWNEKFQDRLLQNSQITMTPPPSHFRSLPRHRNRSIHYKKKSLSTLCFDLCVVVPNIVSCQALRPKSKTERHNKTPSCTPFARACALWATAGCVAFNRIASLSACKACSGAWRKAP